MSCYVPVVISALGAAPVLELLAADQPSRVGRLKIHRLTVWRVIGGILIIGGVLLIAVSRAFSSSE